MQVRGSVPLLWAQPPTLKYTPKAVLEPGPASAAALERHMRELLRAYGSVTMVNLVNMTKWEGRLGGMFEHEVGQLCERMRLGPERLRCARVFFWFVFKDCHVLFTCSPFKSLPPLRPQCSYVGFDFHHECGSTRYHNLAKLVAALQPDLARQAYFHASYRPGRARGSGMTTAVWRLQTGVVRTNCIDCLDRTNVVQGLLGRLALEAQLRQLGSGDDDGVADQLAGRGAVMSSTESLATAFPELEGPYKVLWADHGDALSRQYAGTGALKSDYTRTGKRSLSGILQDGQKAAARYLLNNYFDGERQDSMSLLVRIFVTLA